MKTKLEKAWKIFVITLIAVFITAMASWFTIYLYNMGSNVYQMGKEDINREVEEFKEPINNAIDNAIDKREQLLKGLGGKNE